MNVRTIAPIAQRIEQIPPKDEIQVRFLVGAPSETVFGTFDKSRHLVQNVLSYTLLWNQDAFSR